MICLAGLYTQVFFYYKCHLNHDKELVSLGALYAACKNRSMRKKTESYFYEFYGLKMKHQSKNLKPFNEGVSFPL